MIVYQTDHDGVFRGPIEADESPLEPGVFLIPAGCVEEAPPSIPSGSVARLVDGSWQIEAMADAPDLPGFTLPPTSEQVQAGLRAAVTAECDRRIAERFFFQGVHFDFDADSRQKVSGGAQWAALAKQGGAQADDLLWWGGSEPFVWFAADNSPIEMDADTVIAFGIAAARHVTAHTYAARLLKAMAEVPADFAADRYWP